MNSRSIAKEGININYDDFTLCHSCFWSCAYTNQAGNRAAHCLKMYDISKKKICTLYEYSKIQENAMRKELKYDIQ